MAFNFNGMTPKKILYNGLNVAKLVYNGVVVWLAKILTTLTGYPITLTNSTGDNLVNYRIYGNADGVGDLITDSSSENYNKYEIPIIVKGKNIVNIQESSRTPFCNSTPATYWAHTIFDNEWVLANLKPNTTYGVRFEVYCEEVPEYDSEQASSLGFTLYKGSGKLNLHFRDSYYIKAGETRSVRAYFTTPEDLTGYTILGYSNRYLKDGVGVMSQVVFKEFQIEEGENITDYEPYIEPITTNIYLDEPLYENEYISHKENNLPTIVTHEGTNIIEVDTSISPSNMEVQYYAKGVS